MMLSEPPSAVANGWVTGYLSKLIYKKVVNASSDKYMEYALLQIRLDKSCLDIDHAGVPQYLTLLHGFRTHCVELRVKLGKTLDELIA